MGYGHWRGEVIGLRSRRVYSASGRAGPVEKNEERKREDGWVSPGTRRCPPRRRRKSCWLAIWISSRWPRWSCVCTRHRWLPGSRPRGSATGSDPPRPCTRNRWPCTVCRPRGSRPWPAGTPGTRRPWARPARAAWAARCRCPASASCGCGGCTWWPRVASEPRGSRTSWSGRGRPRVRRWRRRTGRCCGHVRWHFRMRPTGRRTVLIAPRSAGQGTFDLSVKFLRLKLFCNFKYTDFSTYILIDNILLD